MKEPRGIRLNNPGLIRHSADKWDGRAEVQDDPEFVRFQQPQFGIRAIARILISYEKKGINTVRQIVNRWAPPKENDTGSYVLHIAQKLDVDPDQELDVDEYVTMEPLVKAIILHENGKQPYSDKLIRDALRMAGVHGTPKKGLTERGGFKTQAVATTATGLSLAATVAEPVKKAADGLEPFTGSPIIGQVIIGLLTVAGAATLAGMVGTWLKTRKGL